VARKSAELNGLEGRARDKVLKKAEKQLPKRKKEIEAARKKLEDELAKQGNR